MTKKERDIEMFYCIIQWIKENKRKPNMKSLNEIERKYANRLKDLRRALKGKETKNEFHKEYSEIIELLGMSFLFTNNKR